MANGRSRRARPFFDIGLPLFSSGQGRSSKVEHLAGIAENRHPRALDLARQLNRLQEIAEALRPRVPIALDGLSDRIANVILQLPITVLMTTFGRTRTSGDFSVAAAWHPKATPRVLRATCEKQHDHTISEFMSANAQGAEAVLPMHGGEGCIAPCWPFDPAKEKYLAMKYRVA
jgi:hypothetical protein